MNGLGLQVLQFGHSSYRGIDIVYNYSYNYSEGDEIAIVGQFEVICGN